VSFFFLIYDLFMQVIITDLKNPQNSVVVCVEEAPVLKMCFTADQQAVWVSSQCLDGALVTVSWKLSSLTYYQLFGVCFFFKNIFYRCRRRIQVSVVGNYQQRSISKRKPRCLRPQSR
jgi:hypothetical protein